MSTLEVPHFFRQHLAQHQTGLPKYRLIQNAIVQGIDTDYWKSGDKLPTEEELVMMTGYSLGTVQRALRNLSDQGVLVRSHGLGTFVASRKDALQDPWHCRFLAQDGISFLPVYSTLLSRNETQSEDKGRDYFAAALDKNVVAVIERLVNVNKEFDVFTEFYFDKNVFPALWAMPLETLNGLNFKRQILTGISASTTRFGHFVAMHTFNDEICARLGVKSGTTGLLLQVFAHLGTETCLYYQRFYIPPTDKVLCIPEQGLQGPATMPEFPVF